MFKRIFGNKKLVKKILFTVGLVFLFRFGSLISIPGVTLSEENQLISDTGSFLGILNVLGGGGLASFSLFALGVTPYITASIIVQLLSSDVIPSLSRLNKQGEKGRIKIEKITRIFAIFFAIFQGLAIFLAMKNIGYISIDVNNTSLVVFLIILTMVTGSMISIWIADEITIKGVGNGTSMLILSGIVASFPYKILGAWGNFVNGTESALFLGFVQFFIYMLIAFLALFVLSFFETSERKIPIQQTGQGLNLIEDKQTYLPIKLNPAGVVPVIFASAMITLPPTIVQFFSDSNWKNWIIDNFALTAPLGLTVYALLIIAFTYFYAHININPEETAENFQKSSTFIIGVKPGEDTRQYLNGVINSVSTFGGLILTMVAITPYLLTFVGIPQSITIGGTSMIIATSVAIDTWDQIKSRVIAEETKKQVKIQPNISKKNVNKKVKEENILFK